MKKIVMGIAALSLALFVAGCASGPSAGMQDVQDARRSRPDNVLAGVASSEDKARSESQARSQLTRALSSIAKNIASDYRSAGGAGADALETEFIQAVARVQISGIETAKQHQEKKVWWTVYYLNKSAAQSAIKSAEAAAKANVPAAAAFNSDTYFEARFREAAGREWAASASN